MLLGLRQFGYKEMERIHTHWLPTKTINEIKHRYKNITCAKAPIENPIKKWKNTHNLPLTEEEEGQLAKAIKWFGPNNRWQLISKCFLQNRSPQILKQEYQSIVKSEDRADKFGNLILEEDQNKWDEFEMEDAEQQEEEDEEMEEAAPGEEHHEEESNQAAADDDSEYDEVEL